MQTDKQITNQITATQVPLPKGGGAIQGIGETFQADEFTGTASLSIPIKTSSCRGFEPTLSVDYSSGSGNGSFGLGFNLSIPKISRKTSKGLPKYDSYDTFLLFNGEELVPESDGSHQAMIVNLLAQDWGGLYGQELDISLETLRKLEPSEQVKHLFEQAKQQTIFPPEIEMEQMLTLWEVFQTNLIAMYHYQPKTYPGSIVLLNASETPPEVIEDPTHGWGHLVLDDIQTHTITGDHYTIIKAPQVECLTEKLNKHLKLIQSKQDREVTRRL